MRPYDLKNRFTLIAARESGSENASRFLLETDMTSTKARPCCFSERQLAKLGVKVVNFHNPILACKTCG